MSILKDEKFICSICLNGENLIKMKCCKSFHHEECLNLWYENNNTCPTCRSKRITDEISETRYYGVDGGASSLSFVTGLRIHCFGLNHSFLTPRARFNSDNFIHEILNSVKD